VNVRTAASAEQWAGKARQVGASRLFGSARTRSSGRAARAVPRANSGSARSQAGLGIGLALVRHLTELHGGTVSAESAGEGKGATFRVHLAITTTPSIDPMGDQTAQSNPPVSPEMRAKIRQKHAPGKLGLIRSYVMVNTFLYGLKGQMDAEAKTISSSASIKN
jgi:Histidine kinase-, DNA gyrase B-, and HSP90-like ATPase